MSISRRSFVQSLAAVSPLLFGAGWIPAGPSRLPGTFTPLRRNVGLFEGRGGTIGWLAAADAVVVVDSQFADSAVECRDGLRARRDRPVDYLLNTHHHGDHTSGNGVFAGEATLVAHANVPRLQREAAARSQGGDTPVTASVTFEDTWSIDLGSERVTMRHYGPAHTSGDATVHFEQADVVHMGDLVFNRRPPVIDRPGGASVAGWIGLLERAHQDHTDDTVFIFGHGNPTHGIVGTREDLLAMRDFLTAMIEYVDAGLNRGVPADSIVAARVLPGFDAYVLPDRPDGLARPLRAVVEERSESR